MTCRGSVDGEGGGPCDELRLPGLRLIGIGGLALASGSLVFLWDFMKRRAQQQQKRKRVFARSVRRYLKEFSDELEMEQQRASSVAHVTTLSQAVPVPSEELPFVFSASFYGAWKNEHEVEGSPSPHVQVQLPLPPAATASTAVAPSASPQADYKAIYIVGLQPGNKKLTVRRGASDDDVRSAVARSLRVGENDILTVEKDGQEVAAGALSYDRLVDNAIYTVRKEENVRKRRHTMIVQGTEAAGFRYSVGVDWREVSNMLRKAIQYGEEETIVHRLHELLAMHLLERLDAFYEDPENENYSIGKTLDELDKDLSSVAEVLGMRYRVDVLVPYRPDTPAAVPPLSPSGRRRDWDTIPNARQLVDTLEEHLSARNAMGWRNLFDLLQRSYFQRENIVLNSVSWLLSVAAGMLQPYVTALQARLARDVASASSTSEIPQVGQVLFWTLTYTVITDVLNQGSKILHTRQTMQTVQILRKKCAFLMSRADQTFLDTHEVEDILTTLEIDIGNIGLLLRYARGWLIDTARILGSLRIILTTLLFTKGQGDRCGVPVVVGAAVGVILAEMLRHLQIGASRWLDHVPEEEDEVQEYAPGCRVQYAGKKLLGLDKGTVDIGDEGTIVEVLPNGSDLLCRFPGAGDAVVAEDSLKVLDHVNSASWGAPEMDYDDVWEPDTFMVARLCGKDVEEVEGALATKDLQIKKQSEFLLVPSVIKDFLDAVQNTAPKFLMLVVALWLLKTTAPAGESFTAGSQLLMLETESLQAITGILRIQAEVRSLVHNCFVGARRTLHLLGYQPVIQKLPDPCEGEQLAPSRGSVRGEVEFRNVCFAFPSSPDVSILCDLSFKIEAGSHVAIVGPSGCGKSSIFNLLSRLYDPQSGTVLLDGVDLREYDVKNLRRNLINVAVQDPYMFDATLQYNVKYAKPAAERSEVQAALVTAAADQVIDRLPEKLLTVVGGGTKVSGGEQKRIGLARTLLSTPRVLLLDEPTAGLDGNTERLVKKRLKLYQQRTNTTMITVSHNLSFIQDCDKIVVLGHPDSEHKGSVIASGTHDELVVSCQEYLNLALSCQIRSPGVLSPSPSSSEAETDLVGGGSLMASSNPSPQA